MSSADAALQKACTIGGEIVNALSVSTGPAIDICGIDTAIQKASQLVGLSSRVGPLMQHATVSSSSLAHDRNFTDQGMTP